MKLGSYLEQIQSKPSDFAALIGVHRSTVIRWVESEKMNVPQHRPSWGHLANIFAATKGAVTANDFVRLTEQRSE